MNTLETFRKPDTNFSMGMELECFFNYERTLTIPDYQSYYNFWYATRDGSITVNIWREKGVEFVSQPLSKTWLKKEIRRLHNTFNWEWNSSCGIHVHVSRKWLSVKKAHAIYKFYCSIDDDLRRRWFGRASNDYTRTEAFNKTRYNAINTGPKDTIEFRMFSSGSCAWAQYCVDMVDYLIRNSSHLNVDAVEAAHLLLMKENSAQHPYGR